MAAAEPDSFPYDCIVIVLGHTKFVPKEKNFLRVPSGMTIKTILLADPCLISYVGMEDIDPVTDMFEKKDFYGKSPQEILAELNKIYKTGMPSYLRPGEREFLSCSGEISKPGTEKFYYNRVWEFTHEIPEEYGCVIVISKGLGETIKVEKKYESQIATGEFVVTKEQIIRDIYPLFIRPLFIDIGCCEVEGPPEAVQYFKKLSAFGGKRKTKRKKQKNSYRSRNHKNTQR